MEKLPAPTPNAAQVAKLTTGITATILGVFFPGAGALGPVANFAIEKFVRRPEKILVEELRKGNIELLSDEKASAFIPMAYKFFEAAKEGEYEHNLKILAEFIKNELGVETPDASTFARMARRMEGITHDELKVIALINATTGSIAVPTGSSDVPTQNQPRILSASLLANDPRNGGKFNRQRLQEMLNELAGRGLLVVDGATRLSKHEEYYLLSSSFRELIDKAKNAVNETLD